MLKGAGKAAESLDKKSKEKRSGSRRKSGHSHAAVRGVGCEPAAVEEAKGRAEARDFDGLERLSAHAASDSELESFAKEGGLGF